MDLGAYTQITNLDSLAKNAGISVERVRGYRLMEGESPYSKEELDIYLNKMIADYWRFRSDDTEHDSNDYVNGYRPPSIPKGRFWHEYYGGNEKGFWDTDSRFWKVKRVHRISLFQEIGMLKARFKHQYSMWNRFAGLEDILYIHARLGGSNWKGYYDDDERAEQEIHDGYWIERQPWFICKCDDAFDPTYCDIYARIVTEKEKADTSIKEVGQ